MIMTCFISLFFSFLFFPFYSHVPFVFACFLAYTAFWAELFLFRLGVYTQVANCTLALVVEFASR